MHILISLASISLLKLSSAAASPQDPAPYQCNPAHQYPPGQCCDGQALTLYSCPAPTSTPYQCNPAHQYPAGQCCDGQALTLYSCNATTPTPPPVVYTTITTKCSTANGTTVKPYLLTYTTPCPTTAPAPPPAGGNPPPAGGNPPPGNGTKPTPPADTPKMPQFTGAAVANFAGSAGFLGALFGGLAFLL